MLSREELLKLHNMVHHVYTEGVKIWYETEHSVIVPNVILDPKVFEPDIERHAIHMVTESDKIIPDENRERQDGRQDRLEAEKEYLRCEIAYAVVEQISHPENCNTFKHKADFGNVEVRGTPFHKNNLIIRFDDKKRRPFVLVTGSYEEGFKIHGWIYGWEAVIDGKQMFEEGKPYMLMFKRNLKSFESLTDDIKYGDERKVPSHLKNDPHARKRVKEFRAAHDLFIELEKQKKENNNV